jgi:hypothetical protein
MNEECRPMIRNENTRRVEKLLLFEMPVVSSFQDSETGLLGDGDGHAGGKFRRAEGLQRLLLNLLTAGRAVREIRFASTCAVFKSVPAKLARLVLGNVKAQGHGS